MKPIQIDDDENIRAIIIGSIEKDTGKTIFTMRTLERTPEGLEVLVVFEDRSVLSGFIGAKKLDDGAMVCRIKGRYI